MSPTRNHVVMFSGGITSWAAGRRIADQHGTDDMVLLFADTLTEDEDLYRFLPEAAANIGVPITRIAEGRDIWQVMFDVRFLGNNRIDPCSRVLKRELMRRWVEERYDPADTAIVLGLDWTEDERLQTSRERWAPWPVRFPLNEPPRHFKHHWEDELRAAGIQPPRLYAMGFDHNNCGGFCIKAGQGHFAKLLAQMPERYAYHEAKEQELRQHLGADVAILRDRAGGETRPLTLREFREGREAGKPCDLFDIGGCGCVA